MLSIRPALQRGHFNHGWLDTWHTFSFASYHDPAHMQYASLRVINEDFIAPGQGFPMHPHRDMEILTYILSGSVEHKDSMGNITRINKGEFQIMSAGSGILHSEYNPHQDQGLHLYQIWMLPQQQGLPPRYEQRQFPDKPGKQLILSPDARDHSLRIFQDLFLWRWRLTADEQVILPLQAERHYWLQVVSGQLSIDGHQLGVSDGVGIREQRQLSLHSHTDSEILLFDMSLK
ncbi:MAG: pirin family protein [Enterobacteriaceae bacterium]